MKRLISFLIIVSAFSMSTFVGNAQVNIASKVILKRHHPIGGATRPSKAPALISLSLEILYDKFSDTLYFYDEKDDVVSYIVYNDNAPVLQGEYDFSNTCSHSISLGLDSGSYTIVVLINNINYYGVFDVE